MEGNISCIQRSGFCGCLITDHMFRISFRTSLTLTHIIHTNNLTCASLITIQQISGWPLPRSSPLKQRGRSSSIHSTPVRTISKLSERQKLDSVFCRVQSSYIFFTLFHQPPHQGEHGTVLIHWAETLPHWCSSIAWVTFESRCIIWKDDAWMVTSQNNLHEGKEKICSKKRYSKFKTYWTHNSARK